jgi:hypothetical protein
MLLLVFSQHQGVYLNATHVRIYSICRHVFLRVHDVALLSPKTATGINKLTIKSAHTLQLLNDHFNFQETGFNL